MKRKIVPYRKRQTIFSQGDKSSSVLYLQTGTVKITVTSSAGKEAVIALLQPGDFFGDGHISAIASFDGDGDRTRLGPGDREGGDDFASFMTNMNFPTALLLTCSSATFALKRIWWISFSIPVRSAWLVRCC